MKLFKQAVVLVSGALLAGLTGCGSDFGGASLLTPKTTIGDNGPVTFLSRPGAGSDVNEKIIGSNDLVRVDASGSNIPAKYRAMLDAFGRMSMGCTATHIGNGLVLSAGHCFNGGATRIDNAACSGTTVSWGLRGGKAPYLVSRCTKILSYQRSDRADYAIFQVSPAPAAKVEVDLSAGSKIGTTVTIFGHPQGRPLEWSQTCPLLSASASTGFGGLDFVHQCDTEPGNSGSTIIDNRTMKVVAIHDGGVVPYNYGTLLSSTPLRSYLGR